MNQALLKSVLEIGLPIAFITAMGFLGRVLNALAARVKTSEWKTILEILEHAVATAVAETEQRQVPILKSIGTPGRLDESQKQTAKSTAIHRATEIVGPRIIKGVSSRGVDSTSMLGAMVESQVLKNKRSGLSLPPPPRQPVDVGFDDETVYKESGL